MADLLEQTGTAVHFTVDLASIVSFARALVLENQWRRALKTLCDATKPAMSLDDAVAILAGTSTLEGNERGGRVVAQNPDDPDLLRYLKTARWQKAGILERDGEFYQPYALIKGFDRTDEQAVIERLEEFSDYMSLTQYAIARCRQHMHSPQTDIVLFGIAEHPVLFERVQGPAIWVETFTDPKAALEDALTLRGGTIREFGGHSTAQRYASPLSWEFYLGAARKGLLYLSSREEIELPEQDEANLAQVLSLHADLEEKLSELDDADEAQFDEQGYVLDESIRRQRFQEQIDTLLYRGRILEQAHRNGGFLTLKVKDVDRTDELVVPSAPFLQWACRQSFGGQRGTLPTWKPVCPSGLKMPGDNPFHTDWWLGAGLEPKEAYDLDHPVNRAAWNYAYGLAYAEGADCVKLAGAGKVTGPVVFAQPNEAVPAGSIAVVSHAGPEFEQALLSACKDGTGAVIAEVGGKLAHLAIVARELNTRLAVVENARTRFREGDIVTLDLDKRSLLIHSRENPDQDD